MQFKFWMRFLIIAAFGSGCGYALQTSNSPLLLKEGIRKIYVNPVVNNTYKAGVENTIYNSLLKSLMAHRRVEIVQDPAQADAVLQGTVTIAQMDAASFALASSLNPNNLATPPFTNVPAEFASNSVTTEYNASLSCSFKLIRRNPQPKQKAIIWTAGFSRSQPFPSANQLGSLGTTASLINDSEFDRALLELSRNMMDDVNESMLAMF